MNDDYFNEKRQRAAEALGESLSLEQKLWNERVTDHKEKKKDRKQSYSDRLREHFEGRKAL
jgi:tagatose-1,6-bisphosphate aldolase non-catalytic subunit AgaZ/GatZ